MYCVARVEEAELSTECFGDLSRIRGDLRGLRRYGNKYLHKEVARWNVGRVKRTDKANLVLRVRGMKAELFMQFADGRLLRGFAPL
jgi:hypothetical protein